jgi:hypothetical protein
MRNLFILSSLFVSALFSDVALGDGLEDAVKLNLTPDHFNPTSIDPHAREYLIWDNRHLLLDHAEILRLNADRLQRGIKYNVLDFQVQEKAVHNGMASINYKAEISEDFQNKHVTTKTTSLEVWEHHVRGWVFLFGVVREAESVRR